MDKPKAILFDWDGTLVDSISFVFEAHNHVRKYLQLPPWTPEDFRSYMKHSTREIYPVLYGERSDEAVRVLTAFSDEHFGKYIKIFQSTVETLEASRKAGFPMGVVSNMRHNALQKQADFFDLKKYFKIIAGAGYADKDKPDAAPLIKALGEMGLLPGPDILYVGDTETDLLCARAAKCKVAFFHHGKDQHELIERYKPDIVTENIESFRKIMFSP
ncbi:MAG TPA: HAD family hydrolase [Micavibrio sp.]|jgi:phosphoglycolate phosphatase